MGIYTISITQYCRALYLITAVQILFYWLSCFCKPIVSSYKAHVFLVHPQDTLQSVVLMPQSQCRGSLGYQFYFHDVVENIESGINPPKKKNYKESVVTS